MMVCEQFIFTAAKIDSDEGYQIIAKSEGITVEIVQIIREYLFPLGIDEEFKQSKSLIKIDKNHIAYSIVKNIGVGYDGRRGTLYNHTFVMNTDDFEQLHNDSRVFDSYFIEDPNKRGELPTIKIIPTQIMPDFHVLNNFNAGFLKSALLRLFKKTQVAVVGINDLDLIQNLLVMIPPHMRVRSFSTLVNEPLRQYKYEIMQIPENAKKKLEKNTVTLELNNTRISTKTSELDEFVDVLVKIIIEQNKTEWTKILNDYEKLTITPSIIKRIKLKEIFAVSQYEELSKSRKYSSFRQKVNTLYSSKKFQQASPRVMLDITKKIRRIIKKETKKQIKTMKKQTSKTEQLSNTIIILLDCMNYLDGYTEKKISSSTKSEIQLEKLKLKEILNEYSYEKHVDYEFDPFSYAKALYASAVNYWQSVAAMFRW